MIPDSYEDEVRKRLGLLKDIPVVSMPGMADDEPEGPVGRSGETVYNQGCAACHTAGLAGAPMLANNDQWKDRLPKASRCLLRMHTMVTTLCPQKACVWIVQS